MELVGKIATVNVTGYLLGMWSAGNPVIITIPGDGYFLPLFSTKEKYDSLAAFGHFEEATCKKIEDHKEFVQSIMENEPFRNGTIRLIVDPWITDKGTTRFTLLFRV